ncbi:MAG TPA: DUF2247 family protein [Candidatus Binataceae bacterium]
MDYRPFPKLTKEFVAQQIKVDWDDLAWALSHHWLNVKVISELADGIAAKDEELRTSFAMAGMDGDEIAMRASIDHQVQKFVVSDDLVRERWMLIALAWLYQHRDIFDNPWAAVEELWEAFDHPSSINCLISWMPVPPGGEAGEEAMLKRWQTLADSLSRPPD